MSTSSSRLGDDSLQFVNLPLCAAEGTKLEKRVLAIRSDENLCIENSNQQSCSSFVLKENVDICRWLFDPPLHADTSRVQKII